MEVQTNTNSTEELDSGEANGILKTSNNNEGSSESDYDIESDSGDEADDEDNNAEEAENVQAPAQFHNHPMEIIPYPGTHVSRIPNPKLPDTVTLLTTEDGCKVYVIGTAHFSENSQDDVTKTIDLTQPDIVLVELCNSRVNILRLDEETLMEEAKNINIEKIRHAIRQSGVLQGILHLLFLSMSAHITKELGMAPGGEFRRAFKEAQKIHGCRVRLGDRPIQITLQRALGALSFWQKARLAWHMITSNEPITKEDVEKCKQKDLLEEMLKEMTGEFPALSQVFVKERDFYLADSLRKAAVMLPNPYSETGQMPSVVVGVVGMGHVQGIVDHWDSDIDIEQLMIIPQATVGGKLFKWTLRAAVVGLLSWGCYKVIKVSSRLILR